MGESVAEAAKRRPGRPKKGPMERLEQFSIRLPIPRRLELEAIARSKNESLSQAVERAIDIASRVIEVPQEEGQSIEQILQRGRGRLVHDFVDRFFKLDSFGVISLIMEKNPLAYRALVLPESLLMPGEVFFQQLLKTLAADPDNLDAFKGFIEKGHLDRILKSCNAVAGIGIMFEDYSQELAENASAFALKWAYEAIEEQE